MGQSQGKSKMKATAILLVDDHPIVRERIREIIEAENGMTVCGEAEDRHGALALIESQRPDLALIDITLRNSSGLELIKDIHVRWPRLLMLVISMHDELLYAERVLRAGARGYITKQDATSNILGAIRRVLDGEIYLNSKAASSIVSKVTSNAAAKSRSGLDLLADRELQVFKLTGKGLATREIAAELRIDVKTVETYRARIKEKLNLRNSSELLQLAISWNQSPVA
jgi:DNA-binding NarL/FixJ family response regulator